MKRRNWSVLEFPFASEFVTNRRGQIAKVVLNLQDYRAFSRPWRMRPVSGNEKGGKEKPFEPRGRFGIARREVTATYHPPSLRICAGWSGILITSGFAAWCSRDAGLEEPHWEESNKMFISPGEGLSDSSGRLPDWVLLRTE